MKIRNILGLLSLVCIPFFISCDDDDDKTLLGNDCIQRTYPSPYMVGGEIEFAYAMALPPEAGKLSSVEVNASIPGAEGTHLDPNSYRTNSSGIDVGALVAEESHLEGNSCITNFIVDTCAATLRYYYVVPEEARGEKVSFTFSVKASNNETANYSMGPYKISKMDMVKNLELTDGDACYLSVSDMKVYTLSEIQSNPSLGSQIDLIYGYSENSIIGQGLYASSAPAEYLDGTIIPQSVTCDTKMVKVWALRDQQLSDLQWAIFVDDLDFIDFSFEQATNYYLQLKAENGVWLETADKKYRAYLYINSVKKGKMVVSMKRYCCE